MIYLDNGATTFPKPSCVWEAMEKCMREYCGNPGRSGHSFALRTGTEVYEARKELAFLFGAGDPSRIVFTGSATEALNMGILGVLEPGDHVITTAMEHNSVLRPLKMAEAWGVETSILKCREDGSLPLENLERALKRKTKLVVCTHASNVTGTVMPVEEAGALAKEAGALFLVDGAQTAGCRQIDVTAMNVDLLPVPGHKGLLGPQGVGCLYVREGVHLRPLKYGGTGAASRSRRQPLEFPEGYEAGTLNAPGIIGLAAALRWVRTATYAPAATATSPARLVGLSAIRRHEEGVVAALDAGLRALPGVTVYGPEDPAQKTGIVAFNIHGLDCEEAAAILAGQYGIALRGGFHCAGLAHKTIGTWETGAIRASVGPFNTGAHAAALIDAVTDLAQNIAIGKGKGKGRRR